MFSLTVLSQCPSIGLEFPRPSKRGARRHKSRLHALCGIRHGPKYKLAPEGRYVQKWTWRGRERRVVDLERRVR
jgi:hypothetical protein